MEVEQTIIAWLEAHSVALNLQHVPGRAAFLAHAGLHELQNAIHLEGSALVFCGNLLGVLASYGALADGRDPVVALFDAAKTMVGEDKRAECDALIAQWRQRPPEERKPRPADAPRHPSQTFASGGGAMNIAQDHAIANQYNTYNGVPPELFAEYVKKLALTEESVQRFFTILEQRQTPRDECDRKLQEIAAQYKELLQRLEFVQSEDPRVLELKAQARQAIEAGRFDEAETRLKQAEARDLRAIEQLEAAAQKRRISAAETNADNARLQRIQLRYAHAADYWRQAAKLLPESEQQKRAFYLSEAGADFYRIARYADALPLFEQSLAICREIGDKAGEGATLNNLSQIYDARGDYATALTYLEQSLAISREIGDKAGEGTTLNNLAGIARARGDYATALTYLEQSVAIQREIGDIAGMCATLFNIGHIHRQNREFPQAMTAWMTVYQLANPRNIAQALDALKNLAEHIGLPDGLDGWERLVSQMEKSDAAWGVQSNAPTFAAASSRQGRPRIVRQFIGGNASAGNMATCACSRRFMPAHKWAGYSRASLTGRRRVRRRAIVVAVETHGRASLRGRRDVSISFPLFYKRITV